jgi:hypothetical protein
MDTGSGDGMSRRQAMGWVGASVAAASVSAIAQTGKAGNMPAAAAKPLEDPRTKYPKPPFKKQGQPWPGLPRDMDPKPDHGGTTYRGSGRLAGRKALITGGDSGMGRAVAIAFAREGADVAINYLPAEEPDAREVIRLIRDAGRVAIAFPGDIRNEEFCRKLVTDAVNSLSGLDIVVSNAGRQQSRRSILDVTSEDFDGGSTARPYR